MQNNLIDERVAGDSKRIVCCGCDGREVDARLTKGSEVYPHRRDLSELQFWKCDSCGNFVGCHYKTKNPTKPLGVIPTPEIKAYRMKIHSKLDPLWKTQGVSRKDIYEAMSLKLGYTYHTANLKSVQEAELAFKIACEVYDELRRG